MTQTKIIPHYLLMSVMILPLSVIANDSDELEELRNMVQMLEKKVKALERKAELNDEKILSEKRSNAVVKADGGFTMQSADEQNVIRFKGLVQTDYRAFNQGENDVRGRSNDRAGNLNAEGFHDANDTALVRRARPIIEGTVKGIYDFRFAPDFGSGNVTIFDAFVDARLHPAFKIRAGKYKPFIDLERLQNPADLKFIERSYVTNAILPTRDIGISVFGNVWHDKLTYAIGLNNGATDAGNPSSAAQWSGQRELTIWAFTTPFKDEQNFLSGLGLGVGATFANVNGERNLDYTNTSVADNTRTGLPNAYLTEGQQVFFRYGGTTVAHGARTRIAPQASYYLGPLGFIAEYVAESQRVALLNSAISNSPSVLVDGSARTLHHNAWDVAVSYLLTGEEASYRGVKPKQSFDLNNQTWGAWELALRYSEINLDENTFKNASGQYAAEGGTSLSSAFADMSRSASAAHTWTAGVNWYLSQSTRFQLNYLHTNFNGGALSGGGSSGSASANASNVKDRPTERAVFGRLQLTF